MAMTKQTLDAIVDVAPVMKQGGILEITPDAVRPRVQLHHVQLAQAVTALNVSPSVAWSAEQTYFVVDFHYRGIRFYGVMYESDLPHIGYTLSPEGEPVRAQGA